MKKVLITGSGGAGKSTFSRELSKKTGLPVIHLDYYYHQTKEDYPNNKDKWIKKVHELAEASEWIMEGNYSSSYEKRFALADTFVFLDIPTFITFWSVIKRRITYSPSKRPEMPTDWQEKINFEFLKYVLRFKKYSRKKLLSEIEKYKHKNLEVHIFTSRKQAYKWLDNISK
jgi:adenylate kinase family enzyme